MSPRERSPITRPRRFSAHCGHFFFYFLQVFPKRRMMKCDIPNNKKKKKRGKKGKRKSRLLWCHRCLIRPHFLLKPAQSWPWTLSMIAFDMERNEWIRKSVLALFWNACLSKKEAACLMFIVATILFICSYMKGEEIHLYFLCLLSSFPGLPWLHLFKGGKKKKKSLTMNIHF